MRVQKLDERALFRAIQQVNRTLTPAEARAYIEEPVTPAEQEGVRELVRWFTTRYPTPLERLAYVRRASRRWSGVAGDSG